MGYSREVCPICGNPVGKSLVDKANLAFLFERGKEGKINDALSLARVVWHNIPQLRNVADLELIKELSTTALDDVQERINTFLEPMKAFIETFPKAIEKLPDDLRKDINQKFDENRIALEKEFRALRDLAPKSEEMAKTIQAILNQIEDINKKEMDEMEHALSERFKETLKKMGFPEPEQMKLLAQLIPSVLPLLEELLRFQKVPKEKGDRGELDLFKELKEFYPEDDCKHLGHSGEIDILAIPRFNGSNLGHRILVESKKNSSGWDRSFIHQVRNQMKLTGERFAILAVEIMPKICNGFLIENCPEGVILVTERENFKISYGAVRSAIMALHPFCHKEIDFHKLFADQKINQAIKDAFEYSEWTKKIRQKIRRIEGTAQGAMGDIEQLDMHLRQALQEMQARIQDAVKQIENAEEIRSIHEARS